MATPRLGVVTATTDRARAEACVRSWFDTAKDPFVFHCAFNGRSFGGYKGTVRAFREAVDAMLVDDVEVIACFHDDLEITEPGWDVKVLRHFDRQPACGLAGFGGAIGLGSDRIYVDPYEPMQLARIGFRSNLVDAEAHGMRSLYPERVACLDGFSQIGSRAFWEGFSRVQAKAAPMLDQIARELAVEFKDSIIGGYAGHTEGGKTTTLAANRPWHVLDDLGVVHHFYDGMLGCLARRYGWETWYVPVAAHHYGGRTAVGDPGYQAWAATQVAGGDHDFWEQAHKIGYEAFRDVLPIRV